MTVEKPEAGIVSLETNDNKTIVWHVNSCSLWWVFVIHCDVIYTGWTSKWTIHNSSPVHRYINTLKIFILTTGNLEIRFHLKKS